MRLPSLVFLLLISAMAWGWKEFLIVLFRGGTIEWVITDGKRKLAIQALDRNSSWGKRRLERVDPHWQEDFMSVSDSQPHLHLPPDEVVCKRPKCNREIKRRGLDTASTADGQHRGFEQRPVRLRLRRP